MMTDNDMGSPRRPIRLLVLLAAATIGATACSSTSTPSAGPIEDAVAEDLLVDDAPAVAEDLLVDDAPADTSDPETQSETGAGVDEGESSSQQAEGGDTPAPDDAGPGAEQPEVDPAPSSTTPETAGPSDDVPMGRGATADTITIGFEAGETGQAFAAVGAALEPAYENDMARALVDWLNASGGIRGREVVGVYHTTETTQGTFASQAQATCAAFTEDAEVLAVVSSAVGGDDSLAACLHEKQTPLFELNTWLWDQDYFDRYPHLYRPGHMRAEDGYRAYLEGLDAVGYFEGATVGLLRFDDPVFERMMDNVVNPTLDRLGIEAVEQVINSPGGVSDFGSMGGELSAAVLRFRSQGVTHVIFVENAGIMPFFFFKEAESQGYRPRYGLSSLDVPQVAASQNDPPQLQEAIAIGWAPGIDTTDEHMAPEYQHEAYQLCRKILTDGGVQNLAAFYAQARCDAVFLLRAALERAPALTPDGLRTGVAAMGSDHLSPFTIDASFSSTKRWGGTTVRPYAYQNDCECFKAFGTERRVA